MKVAREILRANPQIGDVDALLFAAATIDAARRHRISPNFLAATLLQESAFDPRVMSPAGAMGLAQFTIDTAEAYGVAPWDPESAIDGAARLLASYVERYRRAGDDPYALAIAAYDAGPETVEHYHGVPPYEETRSYIGLVRLRWSRIVGR